MKTLLLLVMLTNPTFARGSSHPKLFKRVFPKSHKHKSAGRCKYADGSWIRGCE